MGRITGKVKTNVNILQFICIHKHYIFLADEKRSTAITVFLSLFTEMNAKTVTIFLPRGFLLRSKAMNLQSGCCIQSISPISMTAYTFHTSYPIFWAI